MLRLRLKVARAAQLQMRSCPMASAVGRCATKGMKAAKVFSVFEEHRRRMFVLGTRDSLPQLAEAGMNDFASRCPMSPLVTIAAQEPSPTCG